MEKKYIGSEYIWKKYYRTYTGYIDENKKKFLENYEILEEPEIDLETGMTALVIGNRKTKEVEIIFGASQDPSRIPEKDSPVKLENFQGSEKN